MKYVSAIVGAIILVYLFSLQKVEIFGATCRIIGSQKVTAFNIQSQEPTCMTDGAFTLGVALGLALLVIGGLFIAKDILMSGVPANTQPSSGSAASGYSSSGSSTYSPDYSAPQSAYTPPAERFDRKKWETLKEVDLDIARAAAEVSALSSTYDAKLAEKFQTLNDKGYLPALVEGIKAEHKKKEEAKAAAVQSAEVEMDDRKKAARQAREERAKSMIAEIEHDGMFSKRDGKHVISMEMYYGKDIDLHGHAKLVFDDGKAVLRAGDYFTIVPANFE